MKHILLTALLASTGIGWAQDYAMAEAPFPVKALSYAEEDVDFTVDGGEGFTFYCKITGQQEVELGIKFNNEYWGMEYPEALEYAIPEKIHSSDGKSYTVTSIGEFRNNPYYSYKNIRVSLTIPSSVKLIGRAAFAQWENLASVKIPGSVESIGMGAFGRYMNLNTVLLTEGLKTIYERAFTACRSLESINLPESLTIISDGAFSEAKLGSILLPSHLEYIGMDAFQFTEIESVVLPASIKTIGNQAFYNVKKAEIPSLEWYLELNREGSPFGSSVTIYTAGQQLTDVIIPEGTASITNHTFSGWQIESIVIPNTVTSIEDWVFCDTPIKKIQIPSSVTKMGDGCFDGCRVLENVTLPETIDEFGSDMFASCNVLQEVTIPNGVEILGSYTCYECRGLRKIELPESLAVLNDEIFTNCMNLREIICRAVTPPRFTEYFENVFSGVSYDCTIKVPAESVEAYKNHNIWGIFRNIVPLDDEPGSSVDHIINTPSSHFIRVYNLQGVEIYDGPAAEVNLPAGLYVIKEDGFSTKKRIFK